MNDVPHNDEPSDDIDDLYRRGTAQDPSRPSPHVRQAILQRAAQIAAQRTLDRPSPPHPAKNHVPPRRWAILGTLAAAVLAGLVVAPRFLLTPPPTTPKDPVEDARIEAPKPSHLPSHSALDSPPAAAPSVQAPAPAPPAAAPSLQAAAPAPQSLAEIAVPSPPQVAMKNAAPQARAKAVAKNRVAHDSPESAESGAAAPASDRESALTSVTVTAAVAAPPAFIGGRVSPDEMSILNEAPDSPLVGAAVRRAAELGDIARLQFLLDRGADINSRDADNRSPLMLAVIHRRAKVVDLLLAHGADANAADRSGTTPLQAAQSSHQAGIAAALRAAGAH